MQYLVLRTWSLVRPWSLVLGPGSSPRAQFGQGTRDHGRTKHRGRTRNQGPSTKYQSVVLRQFQLRDRLSMHFIGPVSEPNRAGVRPGRCQAEVARYARRTVGLDRAIDYPKRHAGHDDFDHGDLAA